MEFFHPYLFGRFFIVITDHLPLVGAFKSKNPSPRLQRWFIRMQVYNFKLVYMPGKQNIEADSMSRWPHEDDINENQEDDFDDILINAISVAIEYTYEADTKRLYLLNQYS